MEVAGRGTCFARVGDGVMLTLNHPERMILGDVLQGMRGILDLTEDREDPVIRRLYPPVSMDDELHAAVWDVINRGELAEQRRVALETVAETLDGGPLTGAQCQAWLTTLNDVRIVLGVRLSVTEETEFTDFEDDDDSASFAIYLFLGKMLEELVEALMGEE